MGSSSIPDKLTKYAYKQSPLRDPKDGYDWLPIVRVQIGQGGKTSEVVEAIIDSGSSRCYFHSDLAEDVGVTRLYSGQRYVAPTANRRATITSYAHRVMLHLDDDSFEIMAHFSDQLPIPALLGRAGFFDKYVVVFDPRGTIPTFDLTKVL